MLLLLYTYCTCRCVQNTKFLQEIGIEFHKVGLFTFEPLLNAINGGWNTNKVKVRVIKGVTKWKEKLTILGQMFVLSDIIPNTHSYYIMFDLTIYNKYQNTA